MALAPTRRESNDASDTDTGPVEVPPVETTPDPVEPPPSGGGAGSETPQPGTGTYEEWLSGQTGAPTPAAPAPAGPESPSDIATGPGPALPPAPVVTPASATPLGVSSFARPGTTGAVPFRSGAAAGIGEAPLLGGDISTTGGLPLDEMARLIARRRG